MTIYIDGDACPVTKIAINVASEHDIRCVIICDTSHVIETDKAEIIIVSKANDSADIALVNRISKGDIAVTQDYGLACMCIGKGAYVINQNGLEYTAENMVYLMEIRHEAKKLRMRGHHLKGPKPRSKEQNDTFERNFRNLLKRSLFNNSTDNTAIVTK